MYALKLEIFLYEDALTGAACCFHNSKLCFSFCGGHYNTEKKAPESPQLTIYKRKVRLLERKMLLYNV